MATNIVGAGTAEKQIPKMVCAREAARTGILKECAIRTLIATGRLKVVQVGVRKYFNFWELVHLLENGDADMREAAHETA